MLRFLLDLPGRLNPGPLFRRPAVFSDPISSTELAAHVARSPRGNAYLSLDYPLNVYRHGEGLLTWASSGRTAFAVGGLHGGDATTLTAFSAALTEARFRRAILFPVSAEERKIAGDGGFSPVHIGSEAFLDRDDFSLRGKRYADLRQMVNRARTRHGVVTEELVTGGNHARLGDVYRSWLGARPVRRPMALVIGTPGFEAPFGRRYFVARVENEPMAFVTLTPGWAGRGMGLDVMARNPKAPAGTMELLLIDTLERLFDVGLQVVSLGACPMAEHHAMDASDPRLLRLIFRILYRSRIGNHLFNFRSLAHFKAKFSPRWEPLYIAGWPRLTVRSLYSGCRMWGLFGRPSLDRPARESVDCLEAGRAPSERP